MDGVPEEVAALASDDVVTAPLRTVIVSGTLLQRMLAVTIMFLSLSIAILLIYTAAFGTITGYLQRIAFVFASISLALLAKSASGRHWQTRGIPGLLPDVVLMGLMFAGMIYVFGDYTSFARRIGFPNGADMFFRVSYILSVTDATRR